MKIISKKQVKRVLFISSLGGIGGIILSLLWIHIVRNDGMSGPIWEQDNYSYITFAYYVFNSVLLLIVTFFLKKRLYKLHAFFSIILALSVLGSLAIFDLPSNLFLYTVLIGMVTFTTGGTLLVPIFLFSVIKNAFVGIKYLCGSAKYETEQLPASSTGENVSETYVKL